MVVERWQESWRRGISPQLSTRSLEALRDALAADDPALTQGKTCLWPSLDVDPFPDEIPVEEPPVAACAIGYCAWKAEGCGTVGQVAEFFDATMAKAVELSAATCGGFDFCAFFDSKPREQVFASLLLEVERSLSIRRAAADRLSVESERYAELVGAAT